MSGVSGRRRASPCTTDCVLVLTQGARGRQLRARKPTRPYESVTKSSCSRSVTMHGVAYALGLYSEVRGLYVFSPLMMTTKPLCSCLSPAFALALSIHNSL